ncbi:hypothetical protein SSTU70S_01535 [Stutzerimonas stutzeri]
MRNPAEGPKLPPQATGIRPVPEDESGDTGTPLCPALPAELNYVDDSQPGIRRRRLRGKFAYYTAQGERITDEVQVHRINSLAIRPPIATSGSAPTRKVTCRPPGAMHAGASSTVTTRAGARCAQQQAAYAGVR